MKDATESAAATQAPEPEEFGNRKLIRPTLRSEHTRADSRGEGMERRPDRERNGLTARKSSPPEQTHAENFYYQKQMQARTPMTVVLQDGEEVQGIIEWYDRNCIKLHRPGQTNLLIYKPSIKYIFKSGENGRK